MGKYKDSSDIGFIILSIICIFLFFGSLFIIATCPLTHRMFIVYEENDNIQSVPFNFTINNVNVSDTTVGIKRDYNIIMLKSYEFKDTKSIIMNITFYIRNKTYSIYNIDVTKKGIHYSTFLLMFIYNKRFDNLTVINQHIPDTNNQNTLYQRIIDIIGWRYVEFYSIMLLTKNKEPYHMIINNSLSDVLQSNEHIKYSIIFNEKAYMKYCSFYIYNKYVNATYNMIMNPKYNLTLMDGPILFVNR